METRPIEFYYFSGTGNTLLVVRAMAETFRELGYLVTLHRLETASPQDVPLDHTLGLAFPVAEQSTYPLVWDFARALPSTQGTPVFMVDTMLAYSGAIVGPLRKTLADKGYTPTGACEIVMPNNLYPRRINQARNEVKIARGLDKARRYARQLSEGAARWGRIPLLPDLFHALAGSKLTWKATSAIGRRLIVDEALCNQCGLCAELCPVGNIVLSPYPRYLDKCQQCMRCVSFCPTEAIRLPWFRHARYRAVRAKDLLAGR